MSGDPYVDHAGIFLIQTLFGLYSLAIALRFLLQTVRANFYNPLVQFLVKITNPILVPLRRFIPGLLGLDLAALVLLLMVKIIEITLIQAIVGQEWSIPGLLVLALAQLLRSFLNIFLFAILIRVILSWVSPDPRHPLIILLYQLTEPLLRPARGWLPMIAGFDLSPILILIAIQLLQILIVVRLLNLGQGLM